MMAEQPKKSRGCLFFGGVVAAVLLLVIFLGAYLGLRFAKGVVNQLTDTHPMTLPTAQMPEAQLYQLHDRVETFREALDEGKPTAPLELSADEINALIATDPNLAALKNHLYVAIESNQLSAQISFPAEDLGLDALRGRYVNASGDFHVALATNELQITAESLSAKGKPVPRHVMKQLSGQNFARKMNEDPKASAALKKFQAIEVRDGKLIIVPKK
jgi:hypothetical protein